MPADPTREQAEALAAAVRAACAASGHRKCTYGDYMPGLHCGKFEGQLCPTALAILTAMRALKDAGTP